MEKRLLTAFLLSFFFLYAWNALHPKPKSLPAPGSATQIIQVNAVKLDQQAQEQPLGEAFDNQSQPAPMVIDNQKSYYIENDKIRVEISNIGAKILSLELIEDQTTLPVTDLLGLTAYEKTEFSLKENSGDSLTLVFQLNGNSIEKEFRFVNDGYLLESIVKINGEEIMSKMGNGEINAFTLDISRMDNNANLTREKGLFEYSVLMSNEIRRKSDAVSFSSRDNFAKKSDFKWMGFRSRYYCVIVDPDYAVDSFQINKTSPKTLVFSIVPKPDDKSTLELTTFIYFGPQIYDLLEKQGKEYEQIMVFSRHKILDAVAKLIYISMIGIHKIVPNWGATILILSFIIYLMMYPLTMLGLNSMKKMQTLQPRINQLREQYKNNPQRLNKEIMELYKENRINPMSGCLPMLFQMPVFIGLYQVLWRSVVIKGAGFLWIKDLSEPDRLFLFPYVLPIIGNELNILPLVMMVLMFFQQKFTAKNTVVTDPSQVAQQKMMLIMFPVMITFFFYKLASGLCLYFTVFYSFSAFTQWRMSKKTVAL